MESAKESIYKVANIVGANNSILHQIHSNIVVKASSDLYFPEADAQVSNEYGVNLWVLTADCVPILFYDTESKIIGSCHAGWKGAFSGIIENTVHEMVKMGCKTDSIGAIIAPCIRQDSYEVGAEFYDKFIEESDAYKQFFKPKNEKYMFDLPGFVKAKLVKAGINNVHDSDIDTYTNANKWFSFRRFTHNPTEQYGSIVSFIRMDA
ncbi:MAG: hypothetical protein BGO27_00040 [Alphaproteobacteria bacterium 33-17]|nr:MAG: hypothetical protein BGO27_00040 [Alphaproteobacteria bacterium 33-17]